MSRANAATPLRTDREVIARPYVARERGYAYSDQAYELPRVWLTQEELTAVLLAARLAAMLPDEGLRLALDKLLDELLGAQALSRRLRITDLKQRITLKQAAHSQTAAATFRLVLETLLEDGALTIEYYSPHSDELTRRTIVPLHLVCYQGSWHLIAHCCLRGQTRDFALARIRSLAACPRPTVPASTQAIQEHLSRNFGIMTSPDSHQVRLRFDATTARLIAEQIWHPEQRIELLADGGLILNLAVADLAEIKREVLRFGAGVEVLAPPELRRAVADEIGRMQEIYMGGHELTGQVC
ncbi:MAG: hypothetical protein BWY87_00973 [Deltaproteobacteria bacterium ADurb.Bin510]|nr:MAG: hypothetical protein BWY87_00973 [Deltaproteobacteria bacterium ADurb.Bin510]